MLSINKLKAMGVDVEDGLKRCVNNEALYLRLVGMVPNNSCFKQLYSAIENNDLEAAFSAAHGLKGIISNLSLTPLEEPVKQITELLRNKVNCDYSSYLAIIEEKRQQLEQLCN